MSGEPTRVRWRSLALDPDCVLSAYARLAVVAFCEYMRDKAGDRCYASVLSIAKRMGVSERTTRDAIRELEREGWLSVERRSGVASRYRRALPRHVAQGSDDSTPAETPARTPARTPAETPARGADDVDTEIQRYGGDRVRTRTRDSTPDQKQSKNEQPRALPGWPEVEQ